jgi:hypothetical protein
MDTKQLSHVLHAFHLFDVNAQRAVAQAFSIGRCIKQPASTAVHSSSYRFHMRTAVRYYSHMPAKRRCSSKEHASIRHADPAAKHQSKDP